MPWIEVVDDADNNQYVATIDGARAGFIDYSLAGTRMVHRHTEVFGAHEGAGVGGKLARFALEDARARGLEVVPICPFIAGWIMRHGEYADVVVEAMRAQFETAK